MLSFPAGRLAHTPTWAATLRFRVSLREAIDAVRAICAASLAKIFARFYLRRLVQKTHAGRVDR